MYIYSWLRGKPNTEINTGINLFIHSYNKRRRKRNKNFCNKIMCNSVFSTSKLLIGLSALYYTYIHTYIHIKNE